MTGRHLPPLARSPAIWLALLMLQGCAVSPALTPPPAPEQAWPAPPKVWELGSADAPAPVEAGVFRIPAVPGIPAFAASSSIPADQVLSLPQLIDIAQRENPATRQAWNRAREAALSIGLTDALFLPVITANVVAGAQRLRVPIDLPLVDRQVHVDNTVHGVTPFVTLMWLLFDFGERDALRAGTQYAALAANVLFNAAHQKLIRDVTDAFYRYNAARTNAALAGQSITQHQQVLKAVHARFEAGVATRMDIALAQQALAQGRLNLVTHQGLERSSYLALTQAMGITPYTQMQIALPELAQLPSAVAPLTAERIEAVLAERADIAVAYAGVKAAEAGKQAAQAAYLPKVYLGAAWARNQGALQVGNLPSISGQNSNSGVLLGVSMPLYDGGLRAKQESKAQLAQEQAEQQLQQLQSLAVREIVGAEQVLHTALQSHDAAQELVRTATVAYDAALAAYAVGRAGVILLTEAALQLNKAKQAQAEAQYASAAAAANLAFVMGTMVSAQADWWPG